MKNLSHGFVLRYEKKQKNNGSNFIFHGRDCKNCELSLNCASKMQNARHFARFAVEATSGVLESPNFAE